MRSAQKSEVSVRHLGQPARNRASGRRQYDEQSESQQISDVFARLHLPRNRAGLRCELREVPGSRTTRSCSTNRTLFAVNIGP